MKPDQEQLKELVNRYGIVTVLGILEEMASTSSCPVARAICDGIHNTINSVAVILLQLRIKKSTTNKRDN